MKDRNVPEKDSALSAESVTSEHVLGGHTHGGCHGCCHCHCHCYHWCNPWPQPWYPLPTVTWVNTTGTNTLPVNTVTFT
jgi:hypothetical protein